MPAPKPAVRFIFITLMIDMLGIGLIIPVAPKLVEHLSGADVRSVLIGQNVDRSIEARAGPTVGVLTATYAAMMFLFAPLLGGLSDRFGRRPVVLIALLGSGIDFFAQAVSPNLLWLFITRALNGVSGANATVASAYVADVTPPEKRAAAFGLIGAAFGLGFIFGPLIGGTLGNYNIRLPFVAAGVLTLVNWVYGMFVLPESLPPERRRAFSWKRANPIGALHGLGRYPLVAGLAASIFLLNLAQFGLHVTWVFYTSRKFGWGPQHVGVSLAVVGFGAVAVQAGLARKIIPRIGEKRALLLGIALGVCAFAAYGLATEGWMMYCIILIASLGGIGGMAAQSMISKGIRHDEQGEVQGALASLQSIAQILGPIIGGGVYGYFISEHAPVYLPGAPFFVGAAISFLGLLVAAWALRAGTEHPVESGTDLLR